MYSMGRDPRRKANPGPVAAIAAVVAVSMLENAVAAMPMLENPQNMLERAGNPHYLLTSVGGVEI